jgi:hypothetical protein
MLFQLMAVMRPRLFPNPFAGLDTNHSGRDVAAHVISAT